MTDAAPFPGLYALSVANVAASLFRMEPGRGCGATNEIETVDKIERHKEPCTLTAFTGHPPTSKKVLSGNILKPSVL